MPILSRRLALARARDDLALLGADEEFGRAARRRVPCSRRPSIRAGPPVAGGGGCRCKTRTARPIGGYPTRYPWSTLTRTRGPPPTTRFVHGVPVRLLDDRRSRSSPVRVSKAETKLLYEPPTSKCGSGLYSRQTNGGGARLAPACLGCSRPKCTRGPTPCQCAGPGTAGWRRRPRASCRRAPRMLETVRLISEGSWKTDKVFAFGGSDEWSAYSPAKYPRRC